MRRAQTKASARTEEWGASRRRNRRQGLTGAATAVDGAPPDPGRPASRLSGPDPAELVAGEGLDPAARVGQDDGALPDAVDDDEMPQLPRRRGGVRRPAGRHGTGTRTSPGRPRPKSRASRRPASSPGGSCRHGPYRPGREAPGGGWAGGGAARRRQRRAPQSLPSSWRTMAYRFHTSAPRGNWDRGDREWRGRATIAQALGPIAGHARPTAGPLRLSGGMPLSLSSPGHAHAASVIRIKKRDHAPTSPFHFDRHLTDIYYHYNVVG